MYTSMHLGRGCVWTEGVTGMRIWGGVDVCYSVSIITIVKVLHCANGPGVNNRFYGSTVWTSVHIPPPEHYPVSPRLLCRLQGNVRRLELLQLPYNYRNKNKIVKVHLH